jgi:hypothetical protein
MKNLFSKGLRDSAATESQANLTVELTGGLANQLFQWAVASQLAQEFGREYFIDSRIVCRPDARGEQLTQLGIEEMRLTSPGAREARFWAAAYRILPRVPLGLLKRAALTAYRLDGSRLVRSTAEAREALSAGKRIRMRGLFQDCDYLFSRRSQIISSLGSTAIGEKASSSEIPGAPYAAVHIRRGDYVANPKYQRIFGVCSESYYQSAIARIDPAMPVVLVSDDREWSLGFQQRHDPEGRRLSVADGTNHFHDFSVLRHASSLVLSNSTFSWWAAFLSSASSVVCPDPWFSDGRHDQGLARSDWVKIPRD